MNVAQLREALASWPDDLEVAVIDSSDPDHDLDTGVELAAAINHPSTRVRGRCWHWKGDDGPAGAAVLVLY